MYVILGKSDQPEHRIETKTVRRQRDHRSNGRDVSQNEVHKELSGGQIASNYAFLFCYTSIYI